MAIKRDPKTGKYYIVPSPPSYYKSKPKTPSKKTVPHDFVGPLRPGTTREPKPKSSFEQIVDKAKKLPWAKPKSSGGMSIAKPIPKKLVRKPISKTVIKPTPTPKKPTPKPKQILGQVIKPTPFEKRIVGPLQLKKQVGLAPVGLGKRLPDKPKRAKSIEELEEMSRHYLKEAPSKAKIKTHFFEFATPVLSSLVGLKQMPSSVKALIDNPENIKKIPKNFYESLKKETKEVVELAKVSPTRALARVGGEIFVIAAYGKTAKVIGKVGVSATRKINPRFVKVGKAGTIKIKAPKEIFVRKGKEVFLKSRVGKPTIKRPSTIISKIKGQKPGQFKKFQKTKGVTIKKAGSVKSIQETLKKQARLPGREVTAVSVQAQKLVGTIKRRRIIRKPIPGEAKFTSITKKLLKKFDDNKITSKEFTKLNNRIIKETGKTGTLIERTFFADPRSRYRPSRMAGLPRDAKLRDIIKGDFTLKKSKPQILVFTDVKVQTFPGYLSNVAQKLKTGKKLTKIETEQLLKFQLKKSGKFKPIGAISKEPEIVIAPGEIIKKVKTLATTEIKGVKIPIIQVKVVKPSKITKSLLKKKKSKVKLTSKEAKTLHTRLKKESGFTPRKVIVKPVIKKRPVTKRPGKIPIKRKTPSIRQLPRRRPVTRQKPVLRKRKLIPKVRPRPRKKPVTKRPGKIPIKRKKQTITEQKRQAARKRKVKKKVTIIRPRQVARPKPRPKPRPPVRPRKRPPVKPRPKPRPPVRPRKRPPVRPRPKPRPPSKPTPKLRQPTKRKSTKKKRKITSYNVYAKPIKTISGKKAKKLIKVNRVPLSKNRAKDIRNYITDTSLSRTAKISPAKGKARKSKLKVPQSYAKKTSAKFRTYRIVKGKRKPLPKGKVIEKRKRLLDTRQEKKGITLRRRIKQITPTKKRPKKNKSK